MNKRESEYCKDCNWKVECKDVISCPKALYGNKVREMSEQTDVAVDPYDMKYIRGGKPSYNSIKTELSGDLIARIDKLPRIKVGNSNSPTVKYCIDEVLIYDLLEHYKAEKTAEWIIKHKITNSGSFWEIKCSNCGIESDSIYRYCPYCGAKMKGESDGKIKIQS